MTRVPIVKIKNTQPVKVGNSFYFTIPKQFINNGIIDPKRKYDILFK